jgi:hypothetical protein
MIATLLIIARDVKIKNIPGFGKLSGLMMVIGFGFVLVFILEKTYILMIFGAGASKFALLIVFVLLGFGYGVYQLKRG